MAIFFYLLIESCFAEDSKYTSMIFLSESIENTGLSSLDSAESDLTDHSIGNVTIFHRKESFKKEIEISNREMEFY